MAIAGRHVASPCSAEPHRPWGHPDFVLAAAEQAEIVSAEDADLIGETRLGDLSMHDTAGGVGFARRPQRFLAPGDVVVSTIEGIGSITTPFDASAGA
jgi:hypothetical protein